MNKLLPFAIYFLVCTLSVHAQTLYCTTYYESGPGTISKFHIPTNILTAEKTFEYPAVRGINASLIQANDGKLYGTTFDMPSDHYGSIFSFDLATSTYKDVWHFQKASGGTTLGNNLIQGKDGKLYGLTTNSIFSFDPSSSTYRNLKIFDSTDGFSANGCLLQARNGKLYGLTSLGGRYNEGVIFSFDPSSSAFKKLQDFDGTNGSHPQASLIQARDGKLYGMTINGIFSFDPSSSILKKLKEFDYRSGTPYGGDLTEGRDGKLYGMTPFGGMGQGVIFSFDPTSYTLTTLKDFNGSDGAVPFGSLKLVSDGKLYGLTSHGGKGGGVVFSYDPSTSTFAKLAEFDGTNGACPHVGAKFIEINESLIKRPPVISLTTPADNSQYLVGTAIKLTAIASDTDGTISKVDFYQGDTLIGTVTKAPYSFTWNSVPANNYYIIAKATDNDSLVTTSDPIHIFVRNRALPSIRLNCIASDTTATAQVTLVATAIDPDSVINKIEFYEGGKLLGTSTANPYTVVIHGLFPGFHAFVARVVYKALSSVDSLSIVFHNPNYAPSISITSPKVNTTLTAPASISISANASDTDGSITKVDFYSNDKLIGTVTESPYTFIWDKVPVGSYTITAKATDNTSLTATSDSISITVKASSIAPTISIISPETNSTYSAVATVTIRATASDSDGIVSKVDFYMNGFYQTTVTKSPYTFTLTMPAGNYSFTAKATDNSSLVTTSNTVNVSVYSAKNPPSVTMLYPSPNANFAAPASVNIAAMAINGYGGRVAKVDFYQNKTLLATVTHASGDDPTRPYIFIWNNPPVGKYSITAKATDSDSLVSISEPIEISVSNPKIAPHISLTSPEVDATFTAPASITISANADDTDGSVTKVDFYSNDTLIGTTTNRPYSFTWNNISAGSYFITAKATDNDSMVTTSEVHEISVSNPYPSPPVAPYVRLITPVDNSTFASPASITITADAYDVDSSITKVDFYSNDTLIGTVTESPYIFTWQNIPIGSYSITAKATNNNSIITISDPVTVIVYKRNIAPFVSVSSPVANKTVIAPASIYIRANANDADGSIIKVDFYNNNTLIGTSYESPFAITLTNLPVGTYSISAKATDNDSLVTTSAVIRIFVVANKLPTVSITAPVTGEAFTSPAIIPLTASASDADGKIAKVEFYSGTTLLKTVTSAPYNFSWENVLAGSYTISAVATDDFGLKTTSETITVLVSAKDSIIVKCAPNPATNTMTISTVGFDQNKPLYVSVIVSGIVVKMIEVTNSSQTVHLDVSSLVSGIYTLRLTCGDKVVSKQFLKL